MCLIFIGVISFVYLIFQILTTLHYKKSVKFLTMQMHCKPNHFKCDKCGDMAQYQYSYSFLSKQNFRCWSHYISLFKYY